MIKKKSNHKLRRTMAAAGAVLLVILAACSAPQDPAPSQEPEQQVEEMDMEAESGQPEELQEESQEDVTGESSATAGPEESGVTKVAPSGTVNLQELTPIPGSGENVVQPAPGIPDPAARIVPLALADLAALLDKKVEDISVVSATAVIWSDSSLGCPQEGVMYMQVLTSGYLVILETGGVQYPYHTNASGTVVVLCPDGDPPSVMPSDK